MQDVVHRSLRVEGLDDVVADEREAAVVGHIRAEFPCSNQVVNGDDFAGFFQGDLIELEENTREIAPQESAGTRYQDPLSFELMGYIAQTGTELIYVALKQKTHEISRKSGKGTRKLPPSEMK